MNRVVKSALYLWFFMVVCEGFLRFAASEAGAPALIYIKDVLLSGVLIYFIIHTASTLQMNKVLFTIIFAGVYGILIGLLNGLYPLQALFGLKLFLAFFIGFVAVYILGLEHRFFVRVFRIFVPIALLGLFLELCYELPWSGYEYEAFGHSIEGSRSWSTLGIPRLSGFGRASFETASILFCLTALNLTSAHMLSRKKTFLQKVYDSTLVLLSFAGIIVTTSKTSIVAFLILLLFHVLIKFHDRFRGLLKQAAGLSVKCLLLGVFCLGFLPPIFAGVARYSEAELLESDNTAVILLSGSYRERIVSVWPDAFDLLSEDHMILTGRGLGGIGVPQKYFEEDLYNPGDNVYVYLLVDFGVVALGLFLLYLLYRLLFVRLNQDHARHFLVFCLLFFAYGVTVNVVESPTLMMTLGVLLAYWHMPVSGGKGGAVSRLANSANQLDRQ